MLARNNSAVPGFCAKIGDFGLARSFQMQSRIQTRMYGTVRFQIDAHCCNALRARFTACIQSSMLSLLLALPDPPMLLLQVSHIPPEMMDSGIASKVCRLKTLGACAHVF